MPQELMDSKPQNIGSALTKITTEQFAAIEDNLESETDIQIQVNFRFAADDKQKLVGVFSAFTFESNKKQFLIIESGCHFAIDPDSWSKMLDSENNKLTVSKGFLQHMAMLTVGTARGILHAKTENTPFNKYHLPIINLENMISQDSVFQFDNSNVLHK